MPATQNALTVDADGHVLEPRDTWQKYIEPNLRDRAIRIEKDDEGVEVLLVEDRPHMALRGRLGALGGIGIVYQLAHRLSFWFERTFAARGDAHGIFTA